MSGKSLPEHCAKAGSAFCAWQFPNVSMSAATDAKSYAERWGVKPGFLDPFHVAFQCVKRLKGATFVNIAYGPKRQADKSRLCPGLQLYLGRLVMDDKVNQDVKEHISVGSAENLTAVIRKYPCLEQVLLFLMKYLKERGPLIKFKYNTKELLQNVVANPRFLVNTFMTTLCEYELEFQAAVTIGDYLNYLLFVAFAHDIFWVKEVLADVWGPLLIDFVNVGSKGSDTLKESEKRERVKLVTLRLLETIPWERLKNAENFKITINPQVNDSYLKRKSTEAANEIHRLTTRPLSQVTLLSSANEASNSPGGILNLLGDLNTKVSDGNPPAATASDSDDPAAIAEKEAAEQEKKRQAEEAAKKAAAEQENRDFSDQYGYSAEFKEKHAPHGMCKPGFDPTLST
ncbi:hypothetical protein BOX15_Mlig033197g2 [Macrostomum lignano]|uniref:Rab-GAP TBC domain-containing protein n=2 Tax=Macrostomum lignano TaxID=282301 RepID=A0A1I8IKE8_9PLAT|nr:hypothetical protein BOX15_Mlig033197g2 [Macrostomum lignano]